MKGFSLFVALAGVAMLGLVASAPANNFGVVFRSRIAVPFVPTTNVCASAQVVQPQAVQAVQVQQAYAVQPAIALQAVSPYASSFAVSPFVVNPFGFAAQRVGFRNRFAVRGRGAAIRARGRR